MYDIDLKHLVRALIVIGARGKLIYDEKRKGLNQIQLCSPICERIDWGTLLGGGRRRTDPVAGIIEFTIQFKILYLLWCLLRLRAKFRKTGHFAYL